MHCTAELRDAMKKISNEKSNTNHEETTPGKIKGYAEDFNNIFERFRSQSPFAVVTDLVWFDSGIVDENQ